jgi:hypothetical protein
MTTQKINLSTATTSVSAPDANGGTPITVIIPVTTVYNSNRLNAQIANWQSQIAALQAQIDNANTILALVPAQQATPPAGESAPAK